MRVGLITTIGQNIGDDFIKIGLVKALKNAFPSRDIEFVTLDKTFPFLALPQGHPGRLVERLPKGRKPIHRLAHRMMSYRGGTIFDDCDAVIQCGAPIVWRDLAQDSWPTILWEGILPAFRKSGRPIVNAAGGSCYPWVSRAHPDPSAADQALIARMADTATITVVRDDLCKAVFRECGRDVEMIPCSALLSGTMPESKAASGDKDTILLNYMPGGGHFDFGQSIDTTAWEETMRVLTRRLATRHRVAFVCHNAREKQAALALGTDAEVILPEDYASYFALSKRAKAGVFNRMHAAVSMGGLGVPSVAIGNDPPSEATLRATFPAPPSMAMSRVRARTGTGASGEVRVTSP